MENFMNTKETAAMLKMGVSTLETMRVRGDGPKFFKFSKRAVRYRREDVIKWAETFFKGGNA